MVVPDLLFACVIYVCDHSPVRYSCETRVSSCEWGDMLLVGTLVYLPGLCVDFPCVLPRLVGSPVGITCSRR